MTHQAFQTQLSYLVWQDGRCERRADDSFITVPVTVAAGLSRKEAVTLLRRLADAIEAAA